MVRALGALGAVAVVLVGTAPMVWAATSAHADPLLSVAVDGTPNVVDAPAPPFGLIDQTGTPVGLGQLRGRAVALTFLDPVCTTDCPLIAQNFRLADQMLGADASKVALVAIVVNPVYRAISFTRAFDRQEGLDHLTNWFYLTGSLPQLRAAWRAYGISAFVTPAGAMIGHQDVAFVIDPHGNERAILDSDPGGGGAAMSSSFAAQLSSQIEHVLR